MTLPLNHFDKMIDLVFFWPSRRVGVVIGRNVLFLFQSLGHTPETEIEILLGIQGAVNSPKPKSRVDSHGLGLEAVRIIWI